MPGVDRELHRTTPDLLAAIKLVSVAHQPWPLFVHGPAGSGKTCGSLAICDCVTKSTYTTLEDIADAVVNYAAPVIWEQAVAAELAVLDEIGMRAKSNDLHYTSLKKFADLRYGKATIYISNAEPEQIADLYDDRIASRLLCGSIVHVGGNDRRRTG